MRHQTRCFITLCRADTQFVPPVDCCADGLVSIPVADVARDPQSARTRVPEAMRREIVALASALYVGPTTDRR